MSEATLGSIRHRMERELGRDNNAHSDGVFHCPREWCVGLPKTKTKLLFQRF